MQAPKLLAWASFRPAGRVRAPVSNRARPRRDASACPPLQRKLQEWQTVWEGTDCFHAYGWWVRCSPLVAEPPGSPLWR